MPLTLTGNRLDGATDIRLQAKDQNGTNVSVSASYEAEKDYGIAAIEAAASRKYDAKDFEQGYGALVVTLDSSDLA